MQSRAEHVLLAPADTWHTAPVKSWHWAHDDEIAEREPEPEPTPAPPPEPPREQWRGIFDQLLGDAPPNPAAEQIGFAHNGFHVDEQERFQPLPEPEPSAERASLDVGADGPDILRGEYSVSSHARHEPRGEFERPSRHELPEDQPEPRSFWWQSNGRHSRIEDGDASTYGRHSRD
jgi:hypothetical protein